MIKASGEITESGVIFEGKAELHGVNINTDGANDVAVTVTDGEGEGAKVLWRQTVKASDVSGGFFLSNQGIAVENGIRVEIGTNGTGRVNAFYRT